MKRRKGGGVLREKVAGELNKEEEAKFVSILQLEKESRDREVGKERKKREVRHYFEKERGRRDLLKRKGFSDASEKKREERRLPRGGR